MPTVREIEQALYDWAPKASAMDWDNVGHLLGDSEQPVSRVLVALDITESVVDEALGQNCTLIISHHPVMNCKWMPVQSIREDRPQGRLLLKLLRNQISAICMHTNLDAAQGGVNDLLAKALQLADPVPLNETGIGRHGFLPKPMALADFVRFVARVLRCNGVRYAGPGGEVFHVAVGGGACGDFEADAIAAGCDAFVTSDLSYHQFLDAAGKGINLIDAGHFPTEDPICTAICSYLSVRFSKLAVIKSVSHREAIQYYVEGE